QVSRYVAGQDYKVVAESAAQPGEPVRVVEFFLYSCPHCFALASQVADWRQTLADDVEFRYVPVLFGGSSEAYARMFYTAKALGVLEQLHTKIFDAIHEQGIPLRNEEAIRAFFESHGVSGERFDE